MISCFVFVVGVAIGPVRERHLRSLPLRRSRSRRSFLASRAAAEMEIDRLSPRRRSLPDRRSDCAADFTTMAGPSGGGPAKTTSRPPGNNSARRGAGRGKPRTPLGRSGALRRSQDEIRGGILANARADLRRSRRVSGRYPDAPCPSRRGSMMIFSESLPQSIISNPAPISLNGIRCVMSGLTSVRPLEMRSRACVISASPAP